MQITSTSPLAESQKIRLANFVKKLMPSRSIFQERLNEAEMLEIIINMFTDEIPKQNGNLLNQLKMPS